MVLLLKYVFFSKNKEIYRTISRESSTSLRRVYMLAHGRKARNNKDYEILKSLKKNNIIQGVLRG